MVVRLSLPPIDNLKLIEDIIEERQNGRNKNFFNSIEAEWISRVGEYLNNEGSPQFINEWPNIDSKKNTFQNLYNSPSENSVQGEILKELRDHELRLCPSCGEAGSPNTLDHYLPKSKFPHFSVTPANLFPMCDACQTNKADLIGDETDPKFFLHPYFDNFMDTQIINLNIYQPFATPTFQIRVDSCLPPPQKRLLEKHIEKLNITNRYKRFFPGFYIKLLRNSQQLRDKGQNVQTNLENFRKDAEFTSPNSWEHVFYSSVLQNNDLLEYLEEENLPAYL